MLLRRIRRAALVVGQWSCQWMNVRHTLFFKLGSPIYVYHSLRGSDKVLALVPVRKIPAGRLNLTDARHREAAMKSWGLEDLEKYYSFWKAVIDSHPKKEENVRLARLVLAGRYAALRAIEIASAKEADRVQKPEVNSFDCLWLRDACDCSKCVDPSTKQRTFQTTDIPANIGVASEKILGDGSLQVTWDEDIPGLGNHVSTYSRAFLAQSRCNRGSIESPTTQTPRVFWDQSTISRNINFYDYKEYITNDNVLYDVLEQLRIYGIAFIRGIPDEETAVEAIGGRVGNLRDTFYGRTWNVKSVQQAKNVAYTNVELGFHMDLLYMSNPPGYQLLHCLRNSCEGGISLFSDSFHAYQLTHRELAAESPLALEALHRIKLLYHYNNANQYYRKNRSLARAKDKSNPKSVFEINYSPPFQGPLTFRKGILNKETIDELHNGISGMRTLTKHIEDSKNVYQYRLQEGECVIFNNRRVLHARSAFDITSGERWLKGAYLDSDVFYSKLRVLNVERGLMPALVPSDGLDNSSPETSDGEPEAVHSYDSKPYGI
jgi:gamma-butyrobetaine dioxygenase